MPTHRIKLDPQQHAFFIAEKRRDPITKEYLLPGNEVVVCANDKIAYIADNWPGFCPICRCSETLVTITPSSLPTHFGHRRNLFSGQGSNTRIGSVQVTHGTNSKSNAVAFILSFFIFGGGGQIYLGQAAKGIGIILATLFTSFLGIGFFFTVLGAVDAYNTADRLNRGESIGEWEFTISKSAIVFIFFLTVTYLFFLCILALLLMPFLADVLNYFFRVG